MVRVFVQGAFVLLNAGHVRAFQMMSLMGNVIVGLNTDELIMQYKNRDALLPFDQRKEIIKSVRYVDLVVPCPDFSPLQLLKDYDIDVYCITEEWKHTKVDEIAYMAGKGGKVHYLPRFDVKSTSAIRLAVLAEQQRYNKEGSKPLSADDH